MSRIVKCGLIQATHACRTDEPLATIREANVAKHLPLIEQAAREGDLGDLGSVRGASEERGGGA